MQDDQIYATVCVVEVEVQDDRSPCSVAFQIGPEDRATNPMIGKVSNTCASMSMKHDTNDRNDDCRHDAEVFFSFSFSFFGQYICNVLSKEVLAAVGKESASDRASRENVRKHTCWRLHIFRCPPPPPPLSTTHTITIPPAANVAIVHILLYF